MSRTPTILDVDLVIACPREVVFDLLADLRRYDEWLPRSLVFRGTTEISAGAIRAGTTYVEASRWGTRRGVVTEFERPRRLGFHQPMSLSPAILGRIDIRLEHDLRERGPSTELRRTVTLDVQGPARLFEAVIRRSFRTEIERMLGALKQHAEGLRDAHA